MSLTFFSRCEGTTLDGTHDYSAGDTTWTLVSAATFSSSGAKVGTNGLYCSTGDDYASLSPTSILDRSVGTVGFWVRFDTYGGGTVIFRAVGTSAGSDYIHLSTNWANGLELRHRSSVGNNQAISTSTLSLSAATWYFVQLSWSISADDLKLSVYDASGTLIETVQNTAVGFGAAMVDVVEVTFGTRDGGGRVSIDNVFIGSAYTDDFLESRDITSYTEMGGDGGAPKSLGLLLRGCG